MPGWGGRDRTSEWRNQNQLDYPTRRIWKKRPKRPLATSIAWQPFPNKEAALAGSISPAKSGAAGCAQTLKSLGVEGIYIDALRDVQATDPSNSHPAAGPFRRRGGCRERCKRGPPHRETHFHQSSVFISSGSLMDQQSPFGSIADRIVDMDSAWKSPNSAMRTISVLTLCGLGHSPSSLAALVSSIMARRLDEGQVGARFRRRWAQPINTTVSTMVRVETAAMVGSI
jgi:hypothetical protein